MSIISETITKGVCKILINRPSKRNALNVELVRQLQDAISRFDNGNEHSVAILAGVGGNFCAGYDLSDVINESTGIPDQNKIQQLLWPLGTWLSRNKIIIAAIDGHAVGFGFELALKCDFRIGERDSRMGFLNRRFGIPIMSGGTVILPQMIGQARALELVVSGKAHLAPEALSWGTLSYIADIGCTMGRSVCLARSLLKFRQDSLNIDQTHVKQLPTDENVLRMLKKEREDGLEFLNQCGPLESARKFLEGKLCRHGSTDMGNLVQPVPEVTL